MDKNILPILNPFDGQFQQFNQSKIAQRLREKYQPKPYYKKYQVLRWLVLIASYVINIFSSLTASTLVTLFAYSILDKWIPSILAAAVFLILLELSKRLTASAIFKDALQFKNFNLGLMAIVLLLSSMSIVFSFYGSKESVRMFTTAPILVSEDSLINSIENEKVILLDQIKEARATTWAGVTTSKSQKTIEILTGQIAQLDSEIINIRNRTILSNDNTIKYHNEETEINAYYFGLVTLLLEFLFLLSAFYLEFYDYRSFAEFSVIDNTQNNVIDTVIHNDSNNKITVIENDKKNIEIPVMTKKKAINNSPSDNLDSNENDSSKEQLQVPESIVIDKTNVEIIKRAMKEVKGRISSARYRLGKRIGKPSTAQKNIEKFTNEYKELEKLITPINGVSH